MTLENNVKRSFQDVKKDILEIKNHLLNLAEMQEKLMNQLEDLKKKEKPKIASKPKTVKTVKPKTASSKFIAAKEGKKFHVPTCPFGKNIKEKVNFSTEDAAKKKGYKACHCIK